MRLGKKTCVKTGWHEVVPTSKWYRQSGHLIQIYCACHTYRVLDRLIRIGLVFKQEEQEGEDRKSPDDRINIPTWVKGDEDFAYCTVTLMRPFLPDRGNTRKLRYVPHIAIHRRQPLPRAARTPV